MEMPRKKEISSGHFYYDKIPYCKLLNIVYNGYTQCVKNKCKGVLHGYHYQQLQSETYL